MHFDDLLSNTVLFEVTERTRAEDLAGRLRSSWLVWIEPRDGLWLVAAELQPKLLDLAVLLRAVAAWAHGCALQNVYFHLDGRAYFLAAADQDGSNAFARPLNDASDEMRPARQD